MICVLTSVYPTNAASDFNDWASYIHNSVRDTQRPQNQIYKHKFDLADAQRVLKPLKK